MRAVEIMLFVICFNVAAPLVGLTGIFGVGPGGTDIISSYLMWGVAAAALAATGVSIMGFSFKLPAVITIFGSIYGASVAGMGTLLLQILATGATGADLANITILIATIVTIVTIVGILGILQISGGAHGPMD